MILPCRDSRQRKPSHFGSYCHSAPRGIASTERASMALGGADLEARDVACDVLGAGGINLNAKRPALRRPLSKKAVCCRSDRSRDPLLRLGLGRRADLARGHL